MIRRRPPPPGSATAQIDPFKVMTSTTQLPAEHFADYTFVFWADCESFRHNDVAVRMLALEILGRLDGNRLAVAACPQRRLSRCARLS
jgi:hypothetical protein